MKEYKRQHIIKHALEMYVQRPNVSDKDLKQEMARSSKSQTCEDKDILERVRIILGKE